MYEALPAGNNAYFLIDCETTGSKRNWDRGIEYCIIAYDCNGTLLDHFVSRVNNGGVRIKPSAYAVHGISYQDLKDAPTFKEVGLRMNRFLERVLQGFDNGVFVAHNGSTDFQFLSCDYIRAGLAIPSKIKHTICTLQCLRRFSGLAYRKATPDQWTTLTAKGNPSMCVPACANFVLAKRTPPAKFEMVCGRHHDPVADVKGVGVMFFDYKELGTKGLWYKIFKTKAKVCQLLVTTWAEMEIKMQSPVVKLEPLPRDWIGTDDANGGQTGCDASAHTLPAGVTPTPEPNFNCQYQRGEGQPSVQLYNHLRDTGHMPRRRWEGNTTELLVALFFFFFPIHLLFNIARWTTLKATELVIKTATTVNGKTKRTAKRLDTQCSDAEWERGKPRLSQWTYPLTVGELIVWIGIRIRMGFQNKKRDNHYWSNKPGVGDPVIRSAMKYSRFKQITSALSFARPGGPSGWAKFSYVDRIVKNACRAAMGITQHVAIDESMIKCFSRYCRWKQFMPRKPIKTGMKVFALVLSTGFLYN